MVAGSSNERWCQGNVVQVSGGPLQRGIGCLQQWASGGAFWAACAAPPALLTHSAPRDSVPPPVSTSASRAATRSTRNAPPPDATLSSDADSSPMATQPPRPGSPGARMVLTTALLARARRTATSPPRVSNRSAASCSTATSTRPPAVVTDSPQKRLGIVADSVAASGGAGSAASTTSVQTQKQRRFVLCRGGVLVW